MKFNPEYTAPDQEPPLRALAIGPSGPSWCLLSEAERAARAEAVNFNTFHDELGRFTTGDGAAAAHGNEHRKHEQPAQRKGGTGTEQKQVAQKPVGSIAGYAFDSRTLETCVAASIRSMIATKTRTRNVPSSESIQAQFIEAAKGIFTDPKEYVDWNKDGVHATATHLVTIVQKVLENNEVQTEIQLKYGSTQELADAVVASKQPVMVNLQRKGTTGEHSVIVQWRPDAAGAGQGRFLINNVTTKGETQFFTKEQFEQGEIMANIVEKGSARSPKIMHYRVQYESPAIITKAP